MLLIYDDFSNHLSEEKNRILGDRLHYFTIGKITHFEKRPDKTLSTIFICLL